MIYEIEMHLRSLEALGESMNDNYILTIYKSKLPQETITSLELQSGSDKWTLQLFREKLTLYLKAHEPQTFSTSNTTPFAKNNNFQQSI